MEIEVRVTVEVERVEGKFAGRDEIREQIVEAIEGADPGTLDGLGADGASTYETVSWEVVS